MDLEAFALDVDISFLAELAILLPGVLVCRYDSGEQVPDEIACEFAVKKACQNDERIRHMMARQLGFALATAVARAAGKTLRAIRPSGFKVTVARVGKTNKFTAVTKLGEGLVE